MNDRELPGFLGLKRTAQLPLCAFVLRSIPEAADHFYRWFRSRVSGLPCKPVSTVLFAALLLILSGCGEKALSPKIPPEHVTIAATTGPQSALVHVAQAKGYFAEEGLNVTFLKFTSGKASLESLIEGSTDFATTADVPIMFAIMKGEKIFVIAAIQTSTKNEAIVARKDRRIATPMDLKGRRVGVTSGTSGDFMLASVLMLNSLSGADIRRVELKPEEIPAAVLAGRVDAAATWNPYLMQLVKALGDKGVVFYGGEVYTETFNIVASLAVVQKKPETVKKVLRAVTKAWAFIGNNPEASRELVAGSTGIDRKLLDELWGLNEFEISLSQPLIVALEDESRWAIKKGLTRKREMPNYLDYIYENALAKVKPESVKIIR